MALLGDMAGYFEKYNAQQPSGPMSLPERKLRQLSDHFHEVCVCNKHMSEDMSCRQTSAWARCGVPCMVCLLQGRGIGLNLLLVVWARSIAAQNLPHLVLCSAI